MSAPETLDVGAVVREAVSRETRIPAAELGDDELLESYGVESVMAVSIVRRLEETFGPLPKSLLFEYPTLRALVAFLAGENAASPPLPAPGVSAPQTTPLQDEAAWPQAPTGDARNGRAVWPADAASLAAAIPDSANGHRSLAVPRVDAGAWPAAGGAAPHSPVRHGVYVAANPEDADATRVPPVQPAEGAEDGRAGDAGEFDVAIVGISGRFPLARDLDEFWDNLVQGRDCITEIPPRLWDWREFWDPGKGIPGRSYSRWGGFIQDSDCFDPLFFGISNLEAESMDPQERLFLETVYHTVEDAGYAREALRGRRVGVYVSAMWGPYQHYGTWNAGADSSFSFIANRVSYFFDFRGPSLTLDTTCSGSLTTVHLACESLRTGETELAVAGGVNVTSHPHKYLVLSRTGFASTDGRCRSFAEGADGYVPGDGVGAVLLKPLPAAVRDGDRIHAVIRGTAINHGGRSAGYTAPSADAQAELIGDALRRARVSPRTVSYIEAHAPGTALGDPVEIRGLTSAFRRHTAESGFCAVGSVKSNVGHLESAAGIVGIAKVVMQMRHRTLVPSIHTERVNPDVRFDDTPFRLQREVASWDPPVLRDREQEMRVPRRAGVSSFGAGGSNAHIVLEEFAVPAVPRPAPSGEQLVVLSARTAERLAVLCAELLSFLERESPPAMAPPADSPAVGDRVRERVAEACRVRVELLDDGDRLDELLPSAAAREALRARLRAELDVAAGDDAVTVGELAAMAGRAKPVPLVNDAALRLDDVAYTLQVGREAMQHRFATVVGTVGELCGRLRAFGRGEMPECAWTGRVPHRPAAAGEGEPGFLLRLIAARRLDRVAALWCGGAAVPWAALHPDPRPRRIGLPGYPFARERCWVGGPARPPVPSPDGERAAGRAVLDERVPSGEVDVDRLLFRPEWCPADLPAPPPPEGNGRRPGVLLVYARTAAFLADGLHRLFAPGRTRDLVLGTRTELISTQAWEVDLADPDAMEACVAAADEVDQVCFLGGYHPAEWEPATPEAVERLQAQGVVALFRLARALAARSPAPRLTVVANCVAEVDSGGVVQPYTAAVLGLTRNLAREMPQLRTSFVDIDLSPDDLTFRAQTLAVLRQVVESGGSAEIAVRGGRTFSRTLVPAGPISEPHPVLRRGGLYVLVGGTGRVGSILTPYLARVASARVVWIGRRAADPHVERATAEAETLGGRLHYLQANATDPAELATAFDAVVREHGAIDGVFHLPLVRDVARLSELDEGRFRNVLDTKVQSTFALSRALQRHAPGFVAVFSSAEAFVGNPGWGAYTAACTFQDAFVRHWARRAPWPVVAINWGYWEGGEPGTAEALAVRGIRPLSVAAGLAVLERALAQDAPQLLALDVDAVVLERMGITPHVAATGLLRTSSLSAVDPNAGGAPGRSDAVARPETPLSGPAPSASAVEERLGDLLSSVLKIDRARVEPDADLVAYGIDSLTVVALHKTIEQVTGTLPATLFLGNNTLRAVAAYLLREHPRAAHALAGEALTTAAETGIRDGGFNGSIGSPTASAGLAGQGGERNAVDFAGSLRVLRHVEAAEASAYLQSYGTLYREHRLEEQARPAAPDTLSRPTEGLVHLLTDTPCAEQVEIIITGSGAPVLLLPAVGLTAPTWRGQLNSELRSGMRMVVPHPPGYGLTKPISDCTTRGVAGVFLDVIDLVSPGQPVHLVASCLGCVTGLYLARFHPERVASLTLVGPFLDTSEMEVGDPNSLTADQLERLLTGAVERMKADCAAVVPPDGGDAAATNPTTAEFLLHSLCANALIAMRYLNEMLTLRPEPWLAGVVAPTLCVYGSRDRIVGSQHAQTIARAIPGARLAVVEGAGHFPYLTHSGEFNSLLKEFVVAHENTWTRDAVLQEAEG